MSNDLPPVSSTTDAFLSVLAQRQDTTNALLAQILDRLPEPPMAEPGETVELREPQPPTAEPEQPAPPDEPAPVTAEVTEPKPARPTRRRTTKKGA
ncbi:hypothetical protein ACIBEJ_35040 [Nonomuraea sp. NPDC050790]|uniref:hypothetical protein n=1 Tax=Nonomuraea sp. NPDC050790 TaxID=3364371 RepID=UPI0037877CE6